MPLIPLYLWIGFCIVTIESFRQKKVTETETEGGKENIKVPPLKQGESVLIIIKTNIWKDIMFNRPGVAGAVLQSPS